MYSVGKIMSVINDAIIKLREADRHIVNILTSCQHFHIILTFSHHDSILTSS